MLDFMRVEILGGLLIQEIVLRRSRRFKLMHQRGQPQVSSTPVLGVTGSPCMTSGSQFQSIQVEGEKALGS
jgi:hypothetical protein